MVLFKSFNLVCCDVVMFFVNGWLFIVFKFDNFGVWFFYCYIVWYVFGGLLVQYFECFNDLCNGFSQVDKNQYNNNCNVWRVYWFINFFFKIDFGLKVKKWVGEYFDWYIKN